MIEKFERVESNEYRHVFTGWRLLETGKFEKVENPRPVVIKGYESLSFYAEKENGLWSIRESLTGMLVDSTHYHKTKIAAIESLTEYLTQFYSLEETIKTILFVIKENGLSPAYKESES